MKRSAMVHPIEGVERDARPSITYQDVLAADRDPGPDVLATHTDEYLDAGMRTLSYKFITPETAQTTHIFWLHLRNYRTDDTDFETMLRGNLERTFWEDNDVCAEIQQWQNTLGRRQEVSLSIDRAPRLATFRPADPRHAFLDPPIRGKFPLAGTPAAQGPGPDA